MNAGVLDPPRTLFHATGVMAERREQASVARARVTLEQRLDAVSRVLHGGGAAECPVCGAQMTAVAGGGECRGCGSRLS